VAGDRSELAGRGDLLELVQWLIEQVVLHYSQHPVVSLRGSDDLLRLGQVAAHRLLQVDVPAIAEQLDHAVGVQRNRQQHLHGVNLYAAGGESRGRRERGRCWPVRLALRPALLARIDERHHLNVRVADVGTDVEVVDTAESDDGCTDWTVVRYEGHARVSFCVAGSSRGRKARSS